MIKQPTYMGGSFEAGESRLFLQFGASAIFVGGDDIGGNCR